MMDDEETGHDICNDNSHPVGESSGDDNAVKLAIYSTRSSSLPDGCDGGEALHKRKDFEEYDDNIDSQEQKSPNTAMHEHLQISSLKTVYENRDMLSVKRTFIQQKYKLSKSFHDHSNCEVPRHLPTINEKNLKSSESEAFSTSQLTKTCPIVKEPTHLPMEVDTNFTLLEDSLLRFQESERLEQLYLSITSNVFFFLGGFFFSLVAAYVILDERNKTYPFQRNERVDQDFNPWSPGKYYLMGMLGPLFFVFNACMDIYRSTRSSHQYELDTSFGSEMRWDIIAAALFGVAATVELLSSLVPDDDQGWQSDSYIISTHVYLVSAVAALIGLKFDASSPGDLLFALGTMLFLVGSLIDTGLSYFISYGVDSDQELYLYKWTLASAILWTVDAFLYLMADFFFSPAPEKLLNTAKDLGIPCATDCHV